MSISITNHPAYVNTKNTVVQTERQKNPAVPANLQDTVSISPEAREAMETQAVRSADAAGAVSEEQAVKGTAFPSFAMEFDKVTQQYTDAVREHYAQAHKENLTYANPSTHIWDKYKNPDSPDFRSDLSEDERAWAYDHEHDMLNGGKHFQLGNPFVFDDPPTLSSAAMQANQMCREEIDEAVQYIFQREGIEVPENASFRLTVDSDYTIHVTGLEDKELTKSIEQALNSGDNGKNLYDHLKITDGDSAAPGVNYAGGHLEALNIRQDLGEDALAEVKKQTGSIYFHYSASYNPHQGPLGVVTAPGVPVPSPAEQERSFAAVRLGAPEMLAKDRVGESYRQSLELHIKYAAVDRGGSIARDTYFNSCLQQTMDVQKTIEDYYAAAHRENSSYPAEEGIQHIQDKYKNQDSAIFRSDLPPAQRDMYYRQEMALLTGSMLTLRDPYALASIGGVLTADTMHNRAMQAVLKKLDSLLNKLGAAV